MDNFKRDDMFHIKKSLDEIFLSQKQFSKSDNGAIDKVMNKLDNLQKNDLSVLMNQIPEVDENIYTD